MHGWKERRRMGTVEGMTALESNLVIHFWKIYAPLSTRCRKDSMFFDTLMHGQISKYKLYCEV